MILTKLVVHFHVYFFHRIYNSYENVQIQECRRASAEWKSGTESTEYFQLKRATFFRSLSKLFRFVSQQNIKFESKRRHRRSYECKMSLIAFTDARTNPIPLKGSTIRER